MRDPQRKMDQKEYKRCFFSSPQKYTVMREEREEKSRREGERDGKGKTWRERERERERE